MYACMHVCMYIYIYVCISVLLLIKSVSQRTPRPTFFRK